MLPGLALLLAVTGWSERARAAFVSVGAIGYTGLVLVGALQTYSGLAPFDLHPLTTVISTASAALLAGSGAFALFGIARAPAPSVGV